jgi:hypothetical protein
VAEEGGEVKVERCDGRVEREWVGVHSAVMKVGVERMVGSTCNSCKRSFSPVAVSLGPI